MSKRSILLVDDEAIIRATIAHELNNAGYQVATADNGNQGLEKYTASPFDLVITGLVMDEMNGMEVLRNVKLLNPDAAVIILTGYGSPEIDREAAGLGVFGFLSKPCSSQTLLNMIKRCMQKIEMRERN